MKDVPSAQRGWAKWIGGAAIGAAVLYFSGTQRGYRHQMALRNRIGMKDKTANKIELTARDFSLRWQGLRSRLGHMLRAGQQMDDVALEERVYERLKAVVSNPRMIEISAHAGCVTLSGELAASEKLRLMREVCAINGVQKIDDRLEVKSSNGRASSSLESVTKRPEGPEDGVDPNTWAPALQAVASVGGVMRRNPTGTALAVIGLGLIARSVATHLQEANAQDAGVELSIDIHAAPEFVFDFWSRVENFPRFLSCIRETRDLGGGKLHWVAQTQDGGLVEWDTVLNQHTRPSVLGWTSEPGAEVQHEGMIRFTPISGGTRVTVNISCSGPLNALRHILMLQANPRRLEEDLKRMKGFIETQAAQPLTPASWNTGRQILH